MHTITTLRRRLDSICAKIALCEQMKATEIRLFGSVTPSLQALLDAHYASIADGVIEVVKNELNETRK